MLITSLCFASACLVDWKDGDVMFISRCQRFLLAACLLLFPLSLPAQSVNDPNISIQTFATGFSQPTGMAFLGNNPNDFFVIEKASGLVRRWQSGVTSTVLTLPVNSSSERGIIGITLDPQFNSGRPYGYIQYSRQVSGSWSENRVSRFTWNGTTFTNEVPLISFPADGTQANGPNHNGGPLKFGQDGFLYGTTGDLNRSRAEQNRGVGNTSAQAGGIFRYDTSVVDNAGNITGDPFATNPFRNNAPANANTGFHPWVAYGVRNSFGLTVDPANGSIWFTDNGPSQYDEINRLSIGMNGGWDRIAGPSDRNPSELPNLINLRDAPGPGNDVTNPVNYIDPKFSWLSPVGITSLAFLHGSQWGTPYDNTVLVGDNNTGRIYRFRLDPLRSAFDLTGLTGVSDLVADNAAEVNQFVFGTGFSVITDIQRGPDGAMYFMNLGTGTVLRLIAVPEPHVWIMFGMTALALGFFLYRRWMPKLDPDIE